MSKGRSLGIGVGRVVSALLMAVLVLAVVLAAGCGTSPTITVVTTKSTMDSGLLQSMIPTFEKAYGIQVNVVSAPTCDAALKKAEAGGADVALTHNEMAEAEFMNKGAGIEEKDVMYSDYVLAGPASDPAGVKTFDCPAKSSKKIATMGITYVSRSDGSDTYKKELGYWQKNGYGDPTGQAWYIKTGKGMEDTLRIADQKQGYVLTDMETYLKMKDELSIVPIVQGCTMLFNRYSAIVANPENGSGDAETVKGAEEFVTYLTSRTGQAEIGSYKKYGVTLFHPCAQPGETVTI
jgi:tungstate transport system substrate-binding protein